MCVWGGICRSQGGQIKPWIPIDLEVEATVLGARQVLWKEQQVLFVTELSLQ